LSAKPSQAYRPGRAEGIQIVIAVRTASEFAMPRLKYAWSGGRHAGLRYPANRDPPDTGEIVTRFQIAQPEASFNRP
jgi:hypothetical protein